MVMHAVNGSDVHDEDMVMMMVTIVIVFSVMMVRTIEVAMATVMTIMMSLPAKWEKKGGRRSASHAAEPPPASTLQANRGDMPACVFATTQGSPPQPIFVGNGSAFSCI